MSNHNETVAANETVVRRALVSVSDKTGVVDFAKALVELAEQPVSCAKLDLKCAGFLT